MIPSRFEVREAIGSLSAVGSRAVRPSVSVTADEAAQLLHGIVAVNLKQIEKRAVKYAGAGQAGYFPILRGIQNKTVRYDRYDPEEEWKTWGQLVSELESKGKAHGDCEDLATSVVAELKFAGIPARTYVYKSGPTLYHVVLLTDRWGILDPSRSAGMDGNG
jgi:transglutaminase-like putative cysteine protease